MKPIRFLFLLFCAVLIASCSERPEDNLLQRYPHVVITNGIINTSVFIPDPNSGFYRSTRFDWSGLNYELTYAGHSYFLQKNEPFPLPLKQDHDPFKSDNACGLADQFQDGPKQHPGDITRFVIGVGILDAETRKILDPGEWRTASGNNWVEFTHTLADDYGYSYVYTKRMTLPESKPELVISYTLVNTGAREISCQQYNHNFFTIDDSYIGPDYEVQLFFPAEFQTFHPRSFQDKGDFLPYMEIADQRILVLKHIDVPGGLFSVMRGFTDSVKQHRGILSNTRTGASVEIQGDLPLSEFHFWADDMTICPEFFILIEVSPGRSLSWSRTYRFFIDKRANGYLNNKYRIEDRLSEKKFGFLSFSLPMCWNRLPPS
jgi:hypothetical protein